jgi:hypothetical protein
VEVVNSDVARAELILRQLSLPPRTPDALNITIAQRMQAMLATFDVRMADCARHLGVSVSEC